MSEFRPTLLSLLVNRLSGLLLDPTEEIVVALGPEIGKGVFGGEVERDAAIERLKTSTWRGQPIDVDRVLEYLQEARDMGHIINKK